VKLRSLSVFLRGWQITPQTPLIQSMGFTCQFSKLKSFRLKSVRLHTGPETCMYWSAFKRRVRLRGKCQLAVGFISVYSWRYLMEEV